MLLSIILILCLRAGALCAVPPADPARWDKDLAAFAKEDAAEAVPEKAYLFVGSSSVRLWTNLAETFPQWPVRRRGFGGSHLSDLNALFEPLVLKYRPARIFVYAGENDISAGRSPEQVYADFKTFHGKVRTQLPGTEIFFLSMKPSPSRWHLSPQISEANGRIKRYARGQRRVTYIDLGKPLLGEDGRPDAQWFKKDNLHLNDRGYERWARAIRAAVKN